MLHIILTIHHIACSIFHGTIFFLGIYILQYRINFIKLKFEHYYYLEFPKSCVCFRMNKLTSWSLIVVLNHFQTV